MKTALSSAVAFLASIVWVSAADLIAIPPAQEILGTLRKSHPRILATAEDFAALNQRIKSDTQLQQWHAKIRADADRVVGEPPCEYEIPDGLRLLGVSRRVLSRLQTLGLIYRLDTEASRPYADRAWNELKAVAAFKDWNPRHFLDTAEMTHAFAIGYDWFYDAWTPEQRTLVREAIVQKGLNPALGCYRGTVRHGSWMKVRHNWNQVCNGGIGIGALAIADDVPDLAAEFLASALKSIQLPMESFAPDGAWDEGPGYWNYATTYNVAFLAALETALGTDFRLSAIPGFSEAGAFPLFVTGPLGRTFNYADGSDGTIRAPQLFWLARKFHRPEYATYQRQVASPHPLDLLWFNAAPEVALRDLPLDKYFRHAEVVTFRSAWSERDAVFAGFKAGDNKANHSNLDLGTFVLDAIGVRWAVDLGADNYNLPGYFGKQRWNFYRMRAEGHNTIAINPEPAPDQDPSAAARIIKFEFSPERAFAIADLTPAYQKHARNLRRGIALLNRKQVLVQDEFTPSKLDSQDSTHLWWLMHTPAQIELESDGRAAVLRQGEARLRAQILSPDVASFSVRRATPLPGSPTVEKQHANEGIRKLCIHLQPATNVQIAVLLVPFHANEMPPKQGYALADLSRW